MKYENKYFYNLIWPFWCCVLITTSCARADPKKNSKPHTLTEILATSKPIDWRLLDPENTLYLELASGRVVIELSPQFAPMHTANIKVLVREKYFDGLAIVRAQDNYVVQWGDPESGNKEKERKINHAKPTLTAEFTIPLKKDLPFTLLPDGDIYAPQVGFSNGFPAAKSPKENRAWLTHCYGMVGVGRDTNASSGNGKELYVVIGHAPRHLDRNITLVGRVVQGIELLSTLPRGTGNLGFYEKPEQRVTIKSIRLAVDVAERERTKLETIRTDSSTFQDLIESRHNRRDDWYKFSAGHIELCNVPLVVRPIVTQPLLEK